VTLTQLSFCASHASAPVWFKPTGTFLARKV
jgi:hypothetical protein